MNGVEILSSETIYDTILPEYCIGIGLLCGIISAALWVICVGYEHYCISTIPAVLIAASIIVGSLGGTDSSTKIDYIEYKVTIDDSVSMNEFLDKYEIIDQEGKIYTVKEKK